MEKKTCSKCKEEKELTDFWKNKDGRYTRSSMCINCSKNYGKSYRNDPKRKLLANTRTSLWRQTNPTKYKEAQLKIKYGLTLAQFNNLFELQEYKCAACGTTEPTGGKHWCIDHNHICCSGEKTCGKCLRGIICGACNKSLGHAKENKFRLKALVTYLEKYEHS